MPKSNIKLKGISGYGKNAFFRKNSNFVLDERARMWYTLQVLKSGCGAVGSALPWGGRGRKFKSCHSDQDKGKSCWAFPYLFLSDRLRRICRKSGAFSSALFERAASSSSLVTQTSKKRTALVVRFLLLLWDRLRRICRKSGAFSKRARGRAASLSSLVTQTKIRGSPFGLPLIYIRKTLYLVSRRYSVFLCKFYPSINPYLTLTRSSF